MLSRFFSSPLPVRTVAPNFTLHDQDGTAVTLSELRGNNVLLVFYPADETRICRRQLCEYRDLTEVARNRSVLIFGINPGSAASHADFRNRQKLPFPLLVDTGRRVASLYQANGLMIKRTVYLIGMDGIIRFSKRGKPHPTEVFAEADIP